MWSAVCRKLLVFHGILIVAVLVFGVAAHAEAALSVTKTAEPTSVDEGDTVTYSYTVTNTGTAAAVDVAVFDDNTTPGNASDDIQITLTGLTDEDDDGTADDLAPGGAASGTLSLTLSVPGSITNTAQAFGYDVTGDGQVSASDPATVTVNDLSAALQINKSVRRAGESCPGSDSLTVNEGEQVCFCHEIENTGDAAALDIMIEDVHLAPGQAPVTIVLVGFAGLTDEDGDGQSDDLAPGASASVGGVFTPTYDTSGTATNTAIVTGEDITSGETVEASDMVTVEIVNVPPTFHDCPVDILVSNDPGEPSAVVHWTPPTATDPSGDPPTVVSTHNPGDTFPVGRTSVLYTAMDAHGGQATCSFDVTVRNTEPPEVMIATPESNIVYVVGEEVIAAWSASSLIDLAHVEATVPNGEALDTRRAGCFNFTVSATDATGLTTTRTVPWCARLLIQPIGAPQEKPDGWLFIDRWLPVEERPLVGGVPVCAVYVAGEVVSVSMGLCDVEGRPCSDALVTLSVTRVPEPLPDGVAYDLASYLVQYQVISYDPTIAGYTFAFSTLMYEPGCYDLWIGVNATIQASLRIQVVAASP